MEMKTFNPLRYGRTQLFRSQAKSGTGFTWIINVMGRIGKLRIHAQADRNTLLTRNLKILLPLVDGIKGDMTAVF